MSKSLNMASLLFTVSIGLLLQFQIEDLRLRFEGDDRHAEVIFHDLPPILPDRSSNVHFSPDAVSSFHSGSTDLENVEHAKSEQRENDQNISQDNRYFTPDDALLRPQTTQPLALGPYISPSDVGAYAGSSKTVGNIGEFVDPDWYN